MGVLERTLSQKVRSDYQGEEHTYSAMMGKYSMVPLKSTRTGIKFVVFDSVPTNIPLRLPETIEHRITKRKAIFILGELLTNNYQLWCLILTYWQLQRSDQHSATYECNVEPKTNNRTRSEEVQL
eukprot:TRINITY_DN3934_c0_g3_i1.p1 TRINITY_DN3934_c0_g3~~TRINITY_DN3934_c0_g3_i1.p1  ORF type:complete len:125 (+),score=14.94 TRINITY_DN3934_c0_g3_i1:238-612(+)